ncbi:MAG: hypothetical protein ACFE9T_11225 [Promethearchaeota archaeon]
MKFKINQKVRIIILAFILLSLILNIPILNSYIIQNNNVRETSNDETIHTSAEVPYHESWLENPSFNTEEYWFSEVEGDDRDVYAEISGGKANYVMIGDSGRISIDEPLSATDWNAVRNPDKPILPDLYVINSSGCYVYHEWDEDVNQTRNNPSIYWKRTITMPVNMSDYIITSASLEVIFNATVTVSPHDNGGIDRLGDDGGIDDYSEGDYTEFYVYLSDVEESFEPVPVAYNHTGKGNLGQDSPAVSHFSDTQMENTIPPNVLCDVLTSVLEKDGYNFTITLGIIIYCEDNEYGVDIDRWNSLIIRSFNLTFTYEKKIDSLTAISWNQEGREIANKTNIQMTEAKLSFKYGISETIPYDLAPNSEMRILVNAKEFDYIKLSSIETNENEWEFDVSSLITIGINIAIAIQIYLKDTFVLDHNITISIDEVQLEIYFIRIVGTEEPFIFRIFFIIALVVAAGLGGYLYLYQKILKYPKPVRKVRKYRFTLKKKKGPEISIISRDKAFSLMYAAEVSNVAGFLKVKPQAQTDQKKPKKPSEPIIKTTEKS